MLARVNLKKIIFIENNTNCSINNKNNSQLAICYSFSAYFFFIKTDGIKHHFVVVLINLIIKTSV